MAANSGVVPFPLLRSSCWFGVRGFARRGSGGFPSAYGMSERVPFPSRSKRNQKFAECEKPDFGGQLARVISHSDLPISEHAHTASVY